MKKKLIQIFIIALSFLSIYCENVKLQEIIMGPNSWTIYRLNPQRTGAIDSIIIPKGELC